VCQFLSSAPETRIALAKSTKNCHIKENFVENRAYTEMLNSGRVSK